MRALLVTASVALLAGCATKPLTDGHSINGYKVEIDRENRVADTMTSPVYEVDMSRADIIDRASYCSNRHLSVDAVKLSGGDQPVFSLGSTETTQDQGGQVVQQIDKDQGLLVARSRAEYNTGLSLSHVAESTVLVEAQDRRFRIVHADLASAQASTGYIRNSGFSPIGAWSGAKWEQALSAIQEESQTVAKCITSDAAGDW